MLPYNDTEIGKKLNVDKSNFSKSVNGRTKITWVFLRKFYSAFDSELEAIQREEAGSAQKAVELETEMEAMKWRIHELQKEWQRTRKRLSEVESTVRALVGKKGKGTATILK